MTTVSAAMAATAQSGGADVKRKATKKQTKNTATRRPAFDKILVRRDGPTGKRLAVIGGANVDDPLKVGDQLLRVLRTPDKQHGSRLLFVEFPTAPTKKFRKVLIKRVVEGLLADAREYFAGDDEDAVVGADEFMNEEGWDGERLVLPPRSGPSFALSFVDEISWYCGFWLNPRTLVLGVLDPNSPLEGPCSVSVSHWAPDSMVSGSWRDSYDVLGNGLNVAWKQKDEDGKYISFYRTTEGAPAAVAKRLGAAVHDWYLYEAETRLLAAHFLGFTKGNAGLLGGSFGYEIENFTLRASAEVMLELQKRNPKPTAEEAGKWLASIKDSIDASLWEQYASGAHPDEFVLALAAIAEGKS